MSSTRVGKGIAIKSSATPPSPIHGRGILGSNEDDDPIWRKPDGTVITINQPGGTQGPQGDPGPQGDQGPQGEQGPQGNPGVGGSNSHASVSALRASVDHLTVTTANTADHGTPGDGGGAQFYWSSTSTATDDNGSVIKPSAVSGAGRWLMMPGPRNVLQFGAKCDSTTDDYAAFRAAIDSFTHTQRGGILHVPGKVNETYRLSSTLHINRSIILQGVSGGTNGNSRMVFDRGVAGLVIHSSDSATDSGLSGRAEASVVRDIAIVSVGTGSDWVTGQIMVEGSLIKPTNSNRNGFNYVAHLLSGTSQVNGATEPTWPVPVLRKPSTVYSLGEFTYSGEVVLECTTAGTSSGSNMRFDPVIGNTTVDGSVTWTTVIGAYVDDDQIRWYSHLAHGITVHTRCRIENYLVSGFAGDGIHILGAVSGNPYSNANNWFIENGRSESNSRHGYYAEGTDANAGVAIQADASANGFWGFYDISDLGNTYVACHTADNFGNGTNTGGPYFMGSGNGSCQLIGCYSEGGQNSGSQLWNAGGSFVVGGLHYSGFNSLSSGIAYADTVSNRLNVLNKTLDRVFQVGINDEPTYGIARPICWEFTSGDLEKWTLERDVLGSGAYKHMWSWFHQNVSAVPLAMTGQNHVDGTRAVFPVGHQNSTNNAYPQHISTDPNKLIDGKRCNKGDRYEDVSLSGQGTALGKICTQAGQAYPPWQASHAYSVGDHVGVDAFGYFLYFKCTTAGTSGAAQPVWNSSGTTADGGGSLVWTVGYSDYSSWAATTAYAVGDLVKPVVRNGLVFECYEAGTSGGSEPTWSGVYFGDDQTTLDGTVRWQLKKWDWQCAKFASFGSWADPIFEHNEIGTAQTVGLTVQNLTAAADGAQQYSPVIELIGQGRKTDATAASQTVKWGLQTRPIQGAANPTADLVFLRSINGASYAEEWSFKYSTGLPQLHGPSAFAIYNGSTNGWYLGSDVELIIGDSAKFTFNATKFWPTVNNSFECGQAGFLWAKVSTTDIDMDGFLKWTNASLVQTTVGAAGAASAPPASPEKYLQIKGTDGTVYVVPAYLAS